MSTSILRTGGMSGEDKEESTIAPQEVLQSRWCRSAVCGSDPFIPDSEFTGDDCELTCDIKGEPE
tara:strand:- start:95 stop:289 length:195 start_codon:yes stop_codon:yes gene_type:complete